MNEAQDFLNGLKGALEDYIDKKNYLEQKEQNEGPRGELTVKRATSPKGMLNLFGSYLKNIDPKVAILNRRRNLVHAEYLLNIVNNLSKQENVTYADLAYLQYEIKRQLKQANLESADSYSKNILTPHHNTLSEHVKTQPFTMANDYVKGFSRADIIALWPYFLYSKGINKNMEVDYSVDQLIKLANNSTQEFNGNIHAFFESTFNQVNQQLTGVMRKAPEIPEFLNKKLQMYQTQAYARGYLVEGNLIDQSRSVTRGLQGKQEINILAPLLKAGSLNPSIEDWCNAIISQMKVSETNNYNDYILIVEKFPPQAYQYYQTLQEKIARIIPEEPLRPNIIIQVQGEEVRNTKVKHAHVGLLGGTGPLSDAQIMKSWLGDKVNHPDVEKVNAVLFSFPPPRPSLASGEDISRTVTHTLSYGSLLNHYTQQYPAQQNLLLSNTAHINLNVAEKLIHSSSGPIFNMVKEIVKELDQKKEDVSGVLVLGTSVAASAELYPNKFKEHNIASYLPPEDKQTKLQYIIDGAKSGKTAAMAPKFVEFVVERAVALKEKGEPFSHIILSCTELPLLMDEKLPDGSGHYKDKLKQELNNKGIFDVKIIDTEERFIHYVNEFEELPRFSPIALVTKVLHDPTLASDYQELIKRVDFIKTQYQDQTPNGDALIDKWVSANKNNPEYEQLIRGISLYRFVIEPLTSMKTEEYNLKEFISVLSGDDAIDSKVNYLKEKQALISSDTGKISPIQSQLMEILTDEIKVQDSYAGSRSRPASPQMNH